MLRIWAVAFLAGCLNARAEWPFPATDGTEWHYRFTTEPEGKSTAIVRRIAEPQGVAHGGGCLILETLVDGRVRVTEVLRSDRDGVVIIESGGSDGKTAPITPPATSLPNKLAVGMTWDAEEQVAGVETKLHMKIAGEETVQVPGGSFHAWHVHGQESGTISTVADRWFVPGIGWVKEAITQRSPSDELLARNTLELVSLPSSNGEESKRLEASVSTSSDGDPLSIISADALQIVARWRAHGVRENVKIRADWIAEDVGDIAPAEYKIDEATAVATSSDATGTFTLERPEDGWAPGRYRVEFYLGNALSDTVRVTIQ